MKESGSVKDEYFKIGIGLSFGDFHGYGLYAIKDIPPITDSQCRQLKYDIGGITIDARKMVAKNVTHDDLQDWASEVRTYGTFPKRTASFSGHSFKGGSKKAIHPKTTPSFWGRDPMGHSHLFALPYLPQKNDLLSGRIPANLSLHK